jgi:5-methylthioadenosine/S-adenosylhomocysteine deaminase
MGKLRIEGGLVLALDGADGAIPSGVVVADGPTLAYVGPPPGPAREPGDEVLDATGCIVLPGLVNAHTHVSMTLLRGYADDMGLERWLRERIWPAEGRLTREAVYWGAMLGIAEMLRGGVTTFSDMYHHFDAVADAVVNSGIRGCVSGVLIGLMPDADERLRQAIEFTAEMKARAHPRLVPMLAPHAPYTCPDHLLMATAEAAADLGVRLHIHVAETATEVAESLREKGRTPVAHLDAIGFLATPTVACHCVHLTAADIETVVARGTGVAHCPTSNMKLASGFAPVPALLDAGACVGLGTDGAASNNNLDMLEEMMVGAVIAKGYSGDPEALGAGQMLALATRGSAAALGLGDRIGALRPGMRADVIVLDANRPHLQPLHNPVSHLVYAARADDVRDVVVEGRVLLRDRRLTSLDEVEIIARAGECAAQLVGE